MHSEAGEGSAPAGSTPHRRLNALTGEWVLVSPHRTQRPWQGRQEAASADQRPVHDPQCYLCPGNRRANGERNPDYPGTHVFTNDFAALLPGAVAGIPDTHSLLKTAPANGTCRVICFSPRHDLTLARMEPVAIRGVIDTWADQVEELYRIYRWVQVFENKGELMGCSNPHPHGQIWAGDFLPNEPAKEDRTQREYLSRHGRPLLMDYGELEERQRERIVVSNDSWLVVVPFWAVWPFETLVLPRRPVRQLPELTDRERDDLAVILRNLLVRYDELFGASFPYSMGWHGAPGPEAKDPAWTLHAHFLPPLLRSATVKKFMVGYELLAESQRDLTAEAAADRLRRIASEW